MIVLIEKLSFLGKKVPLLDVFIELYIAALKSALWFIDNIQKKHGWLYDTCMKYCEARAQRERDLRDSGYTDEVLTRIETWLAAHCYQIRDQAVAAEKAGSVSQNFQYKVDLALNQTK